MQVLEQLTWLLPATTNSAPQAHVLVVTKVFIERSEFSSPHSGFRYLALEYGRVSARPELFDGRRSGVGYAHGTSQPNTAQAVFIKYTTAGLAEEGSVSSSSTTVVVHDH